MQEKKVSRPKNNVIQNGMKKWKNRVLVQMKSGILDPKGIKFNMNAVNKLEKSC